ncbi:metal dependent phosphohydrolase [Candidatus Omnitrophus magneticus]|uniref:5'-deoxynucleotidase n=1 Tax=Candidatus Omnitrophus magneticus TaxID=1609969 RepID=A0A0F0CJ16_9BACT|nr:metal dependent phosphohydrolase [Candidatus Omnitrophus magneticus]
MDNASILNFIFEAGILKRVKRSGWWMTGVSNPETVADHSFRTALLGYFLASLENADKYKVLMMCLMADMPEARINDQHKVANRYLNLREAEKNAYIDQVASLGENIKKELLDFKEEYDAQATIESIIARDADILECLFQAKEYSDSGFPVAKKFFRKGPDNLKTKSARALCEKLSNTDTTLWWENISKFDR